MGESEAQKRYCSAPGSAESRNLCVSMGVRSGEQWSEGLHVSFHWRLLRFAVNAGHETTNSEDGYSLHGSRRSEDAQLRTSAFLFKMLSVLCVTSVVNHFVSVSGSL